MIDMPSIQPAEDNYDPMSPLEESALYGQVTDYLEDDERHEVSMLRASMRAKRVPKFDLHFRKGY